jgi:putative transposase
VIIFHKALIGDSIKEELFSYLGGVCKNLEYNSIQIGNYKDHVPILFLLSKKIALMDLIEKVKSNSSI